MRTILLAKVESVEWSTGQGSARVGKDVDDWHVSLWFDHDDPNRPNREIYLKPGQDRHIVGPFRAKEITEAWALEIVGLLQQGGVNLERVEGEKRFQRAEAR